MVKNLRFSAVAILAIALGFSSCSKENGGVEAEGIRTNTSIVLSFPNTRAVDSGSGAASDKEIAISTIDLFIYNESSGALSAHHALAASDFTKSAEGVYTNNSPIEATTGDKIIVAMANISSDLRAQLDGKTFANASGAMDINPEKEMNGESLPMVSAPVVQELIASVTGDDNKISLSLKRLTAKLVAEQSKTISIKETVSGQKGIIEFSVGNYNKKTFLFQKSNFNDPNWDSYAETEFDTLGTWFKVDTVVDNTKDTKGFYTSENTSKDKKVKEITRIDVKSTFMPDTITDYSNGTDWTGGGTPVASNGVLGATFFTVTPNLEEGTHYFLDSIKAKSFAAYYAVGGDTVEHKEFTNGKCYWAIYPNKLGEGVVGGGAASDLYKWDVLRNNIYRCSISSILYPGSNKRGGGKDPEEKPEEDTKISVDISVEDWLYVVSEEVELLP